MRPWSRLRSAGRAMLPGRTQRRAGVLNQCSRHMCAPGPVEVQVPDVLRSGTHSWRTHSRMHAREVGPSVASRSSSRGVRRGPNTAAGHESACARYDLVGNIRIADKVHAGRGSVHQLPDAQWSPF
jgi:hypothetical protein